MKRIVPLAFLSEIILLISFGTEKSFIECQAIRKEKTAIAKKIKNILL